MLRNKKSLAIPQLQVRLLRATVCQLSTDLVHVRHANSIRPATGVYAVSFTTQQ